MRWILPAVLAFLTASAPTCKAANMVTNGDFEGSFGANGVAEGWVDNSYTNWGDKDITFARETVNPHSGAACQRLTCNRIGYISPERVSWIGHGAVQFIPTAPVPLRKGMVYHVRVWLRASETMEARVRLRQAGKPWWPYVDHIVVVGKEWQEVEYYATPNVDDSTVLFMIYFANLGSLWVDDVLVEELTNEAARQTVLPPPEGNLLPNGDFDLGLANWLGAVGWDNLRDPEFSIEAGESGPCLKAVPTSAGCTVVSDVVPVTPGYPIQISCRVRAAQPVKVTFGAYFQGAQHAQWPCAYTEGQVGAEWQRLQATGDGPFLPYRTYAFLKLGVSDPVEVWLDEAQVRQDGKTTPDGHPHAAILSDRHPASLYDDQTKPTLRLFSSVPPGARPRELSWKVEDYWGRSALSGKWTPSQGRQEKPIVCTNLPRGWFRASVSWQDAGRPCRNESTFCVLPAFARTGDPATSPFGGHFMFGPIHLNLAHAVGARWMRLWPPQLTLWSRVEPEQGKWHWDDQAVRKLARDEHLLLFGMIESFPDWVRGDSPDFWSQWENYVATVVGHYQEDIHVWEVRNEPDLAWWMSKPTGPSRAEVYLDYLKHSYPVIKRVDPSATVVGGCCGGYERGTDGAQFADELIDLGALQYMDVFSFHYYHSNSFPLPIDEGPDPIADQVARLRARMKAAGKVVPIINSEGGVYNPGPAITCRPCAADNVRPMAPEEVARLLVRLYLAQWAAGVERFFYYNFFIGGSPYAKAWDSFVEGDGQPRPDVATYAAMTWVLDGAKFERTERPTPDQWVHHFATPRGPVIVAWMRTGTQAELTFPKALRAWDIMGRDLPLHAGGKLAVTSVPVYVLLRK